MYLAVDIGGSKTLLAVFSTDGEIVSRSKIKTPQNYQKFLAEIKKQADIILKDHKISDCCCAVPGVINRRLGIGISLGNLPWHNVPISRDLKEILKVPVSIENDANLAGLSEALLVHKKYKKVLYITLSTGVGGGIIINGKIDPVFADMEPGRMVLEHEGKLKTWEQFASGHALMKKYGRLASQINDPAIWTEFAKDVAVGLDALLSVIQPDVVVIGGGVGAHFNKFSDKLDVELKKLQDKLVKIPPIMQAKRPEEAVIYGCYDFIKQQG